MKIDNAGRFSGRTVNAPLPVFVNDFPFAKIVVTTRGGKPEGGCTVAMLCIASGVTTISLVASDPTTRAWNDRTPASALRIWSPRGVAAPAVGATTMAIMEAHARTCCLILVCTPCSCLTVQENH